MFVFPGVFWRQNSSSSSHWNPRVALSTCECARHGKEFCWPLTSRSALRQWCEIINLVHAASTRRGWSLHAYGYQSDLTQHVRLKWNGFKWSRVPHGILYWNFRVVLAKHEVWPSHVDWRRMCQNFFRKPKSGLVSALYFGWPFVMCISVFFYWAAAQMIWGTGDLVYVLLN